MVEQRMLFDGNEQPQVSSDPLSAPPNLGVAGQEWYDKGTYHPVFPELRKLRPGLRHTTYLLIGYLVRECKYAESDTIDRTVEECAEGTGSDERSVKRAIKELPPEWIDATLHNGRSKWRFRLYPPPPAIRRPAKSRPKGDRLSPSKGRAVTPKGDRLSPSKGRAVTPKGDRLSPPICIKTSDQRSAQTSEEILKVRDQKADQFEISTTAEALFERMGYKGNDGQLVWQVAHLVCTGQVPEAIAHSAAEAVRVKRGRGGEIGYFRTVLREKLDGFDRLTAAAPKDMPTWPPARPEPSAEATETAKRMRVDDREGDDTERRKEEARRALAQIEEDGK